MEFKKNDIIELSITDMGENAQGIGRTGGFTFFVKDALPGDTVRCVATKINKSFGYAKTIEVLSPSKDRVTPPCALAKKCGGCQLMELDYKKQLEMKEGRMWSNLARIGGVDLSTVETEPIMGMDEAVPANYRNKVQLPAGTDGNGQPVFGFYAGRTHCIIETENCPAAFEETEPLLKAVLNFIRKSRIPVYDEKTQRGLVRHAVLRKGFRTGQIMVCLVINADLKKDRAHIEKIGRGLAEELLETGLDIASVCLNINSKNTNVILGDKTIAVYGRDYIEDKIFDLTFRISAQSFFQVNPAQTHKLYLKALEYASLTGRETVWDLYCGIGTMSLFFAQKAKKVCGVEIIPKAIEDARKNAALNKIENVSFACGKSEEIFPSCAADGSDVVVLDPPRKGCDGLLLKALLKAKPEKIIYVSCNSATLARDIKILSDEYRLRKAVACDMFPHTVHCEAVSLLARKDAL